MREKNIYGGGSQTNSNGLKFEQITDLKYSLESIPGYKVDNNIVYFNENKVGLSIPKYSLYKKLLEPSGVDYKKIISKQLLPDEALFIIEKSTVFILEKKFQASAGSVDEKLQTCDFKKKQYEKLFAPLNIKVEYIYILNDWFKKTSYIDTLQYIKDSNCHYFFNEIPLDFLNLPN